MRIPVTDKINPTVKAVVIILCCVLMAIGGTWQINVGVIALCLFCLLFLSRCKVRTMVSLYAPLLLLAGAIFLSNLASSGKAASLSAYEIAVPEKALLLATRILSYASFGILFGLTTKNKDFAMSLMQQLHLKPKFAYGVLAGLHLVPTLRREWDEVLLAYAVRQKRTGLLPLKPLFNTLVNGIRWSENVAMAMESKGFSGDGKRTFYVKTPVRGIDLLFAGIFLLIMGSFLLLLK